MNKSTVSKLLKITANFNLKKTIFMIEVFNNVEY